MSWKQSKTFRPIAIFVAAFWLRIETDYFITKIFYESGSDWLDLKIFFPRGNKQLYYLAESDATLIGNEKNVLDLRLLLTNAGVMFR